jgi:type III pantothenate kinase
MKLIVDIGNTFAKAAVFSGEEMVDFAIGPNSDMQPMERLFEKYSPECGIVSAVALVTDEMKRRIAALGIPMMWLDGRTPLPISNCYSTPETLGADRIAAVVGAYSLFPGRNVLVIDAGTCVTYEFLDDGGHYRGGNISPGLQMRLKALNAFTGRLPLVEADGETPEWGDSTQTAIRAGVVKGMEHEIAGYINDARGKYQNLLVFLTGGDNFSFDEKIKSIIFADRFLVLKGLNRILDYNNGRI